MLTNNANIPPMATTKSLLLFFFCLLGLAGFGIIIFEIFKKMAIHQHRSESHMDYRTHLDVI